MVEYSKVAIAGFVSFVVVILTSVLGIAGTVIGSVFSSVMYSALTGYLEERKKERGGIDLDINISKPRLDLELFYIFPLVVILLIELCYMLTYFHSGFSLIFSNLEGVTSNNLFKIMGFGLIVLGIYPMFDSKTVKKFNGTLLVFIGLILLGWGFVDVNSPVAEVLGEVLQRFDFFIAAFISLVLLYIIFSIILRKSNEPSRPRSKTRRIRYTNGRSNDYSHVDDFGRSRFKRREDYGNRPYDDYNQFEYERSDPYDRHINRYDNEKRNINSSSDSLRYVSNKRRRK